MTFDEAIKKAAAEAESAWLSSDVFLGREEWLAVLNAAIASLARDGYVLVPREATPLMIAEGKLAAVHTSSVDRVYAAMLNAAPKPGEST